MKVMSRTSMIGSNSSRAKNFKIKKSMTKNNKLMLLITWREDRKIQSIVRGILDIVRFKNLKLRYKKFKSNG